MKKRVFATATFKRFVHVAGSFIFKVKKCMFIDIFLQGTQVFYDILLQSVNLL